MAELIVLGFSNMHAADDVMVTLDGLQREGLMQIADWARVVRHDDGKVEVRQGHSTTAAGAGAGALWGMLIGLIFLMPLAGAIVGGATGALIGKLTDYGIDDEFIKQLGNQIQPGTSALFLYVTKVTMDRVADRLRDSQPTVLHTSLSAETESQLRTALDASARA
jgi:uncharacterized membrane protein